MGNSTIGSRPIDARPFAGMMPSPEALAAFRNPVLQPPMEMVRRGGPTESPRDTIGPNMPDMNQSKPNWLTQGASSFPMAEKFGRAFQSTPAYRLGTGGMSSFVKNDTAASEGSATALAGFSLMRSTPALLAATRGFSQVNAAAGWVTAGKTMSDGKATTIEKALAAGSIFDRTGMLSATTTALAGAREKDMTKFGSGMAQVGLNMGLTVATAAKANPRTMLAVTAVRGAIAMMPEMLPKSGDS